MKEYLKCVIGNKVTLYGFIIFIPSLVGIVFFILSWWNLDSALITLILLGLCSTAGLFFGFILLYFTALGLDTYRTYKRAVRHIRRFRKIDERFKTLLNGCYCDQVGVKIAAEEMSRNLDSSSKFLVDTDDLEAL